MVYYSTIIIMQSSKYPGGIDVSRYTKSWSDYQNLCVGSQVGMICVPQIKHS